MRPFLETNCLRLLRDCDFNVGLESMKEAVTRVPEFPCRLTHEIWISIVNCDALVAELECLEHSAPILGPFCVAFVVCEDILIGQNDYRNRG